MAAGVAKITHSIINDMEREQARVRKSMSIALSRTAFEGRRDMKTSLKRGELDLPERARFRNTKDKRLDLKIKSRNRGRKKPLDKLAGGILYKVDRRALTAEVGFLGDTEGASWQREWAEKHTEGYRIPLDAADRYRLHRAGVHLRTDTREAVVPKRDPVGNWETDRERWLYETLRTNFRRKMKGERI